ncbi:hypothetical protein [uncultured Cellulomonas sp.]|uniref:hypothetical protein n=1 Tax=uncultured Cellulomonas sp. TaxID=189682 RepID=UPI0028F06FC6|nr:hypothetical protein [uncultured Cellulomonas sp.]
MSTSGELGHPPESDVARATYRHLRMMLIALPILLLVTSALAALVLHSVAGSISAYYLGPFRDVFVGAMVGTAVCLVAYRGGPLEDYALNLSGFYAVVVAFVPTGLARTLDDLPPGERAELVDSLRLTILAVVIVAAVFLLVEWRTGQWPGTELRRTPFTRFLFRGSTLLGLGFLALLAWRVIEGDAFGGVHLAATFLLIGGLVTAVASHGWPSATGSDPAASYTGWYRLIAVLMVAGLPLLLVLRVARFEYAVIVTEWWEIGLFAIFWTMETVRTWTPRPEASSGHVR